jgi:hypothetical protein
VGLQFLNLLLEALQPSVIVTIGEKSSEALRASSIDTASVRHPSYGGQALFLGGIAAIYDCEISKPKHAYESELFQFARG